MKRNLLFFLSLWALCAFTTTAVAEEVDYTSSIVNADLSTTDAWNAEGTKGIKDGMVKVGSQAVYDFSQTITIPAGQYKLTAKAVYRYGSDEQAEYDAIKAGTDTHKTKLYAETSAEKFEVNVFNRYDGASDTDYAAGNGSVTINEKFVPNSSAAVQAWFDAGQYVNELVFNVLEDGQVKIGITTVDGIAGDYANIGAWTLTRIGDVEGFATGLADGTYYMENVGAGRFFEGGNDWGTWSSLSERGIEVKLAAVGEGAYTINTGLGGGYLNFEGWIDAGASNWTLTSVGESIYTLFAEGKYLVWEGTGSRLALSSEAPTTENGYFRFWTKEERIAALANATADAPVSATFLIGDANFSRHESSAPWTMEAGNKNLAGGDQSNYCAESYHSTFSLTQTITVPAGVYALTAQGFYRQDGEDNDNLPYFFIGEEKGTFPLKTGSENSMTDASHSFTSGLYTINPIFVEVGEEGTIELGAKNDVNTSVWCIWDNFQLKYYGKDADITTIKFGAYVSQVEELRATATELLAADINEANKTALEAALAASENIEGTVEAYEAAIAALQTANKDAKACADAKVVIDNYYDLMASTNVYTQEAYTSFKAVADDYLAKWETNTLTEAVVNPYATTGWRASVDYDNFLLSAFGTKDFDTDLYINTWSGEGASDGSNFTVPFFEYWVGDGESLKPATKTATVTGLEAGKAYVASALVRVRVKNGQTDPTGITLSVGAEGTPTDVTEGAQVGTSPFFIAEYKAMGVADAEGNLTINFNITADNNISWLSFKNVKYAEASTASNLDFSEGTPVDNGICTYSKDMTTNSTTYCHQLEIPSWTIAVENNDARAAGVFAYGSGQWLGSSSNIAPATNPEGVAEGNALGLVAVWDAVAQYTQEVTLAPGNYVLTIPVYNVGQGTTAPQKSLIGFIANDGTEYLAPAKSYTKGAWTTEVITFTLNEVTEGVLSLGYDATNAGSGSQQALFFDCVKIETATGAELAKLELAKAIAAAQATVDAKANVGEGFFQIPTAALDTYAAAVAAAQGTHDNADATEEDLTAAIETLAAAAEAYAGSTTYPAADKKYTFKLNVEGDVYMNLGEKVTIAENATLLSFVPAETEGQYYLTDGEYYVGLAGTDIWSMSTSPDMKAAWTFTAVGEGLYRINNLKTTGRFVGTNASDTAAGTTVYADKKTDNGNVDWIITEYVPVPFEVTMINPADATAEKIAEGEAVEFATNMDDKVGFMLMTVEQIDAATAEVVEVITSFGTPVKGEASWKAEAYNTVKFREGYTYKFKFYAYETEDAYNQEPWEAPYSAAFAKDSVEIIGALPAYVYATATLNDIQPAYGSVIENAADSVVTLTFSAPVKVFDAQTMVRENGFFAPPTVYAYTPVAVDADENGYAAVWTMNIKLFPGHTNVTFAAEDAEGRRVWGNMGEEETSYFSYDWECTVGIPDIKLATVSAIVAAPATTITATCAAGIGDFTWSCAMSDAVVLNAAGDTVATVANVEKIVSADIESYSPEWYEAVAVAPNTITFSAEITEPGTYTVKFPAGYFTVDSEKMYMSKATELKFAVAENVVELNVDRVVNLGYAADVVNVDLAAICAKLGIETISEATVWGVNATTLEYVANAMTTYDGWRTAESAFTTWGNNHQVCYKYFADGAFQLCTEPNNEPALGTEYTAYWAFSTATDTVVLKTNITFVEAPKVEVEVVKTITIEHEEKAGVSFQNTQATFDVAEVAAALGIENLANVETFIVNVTTGEFVANTTDGWRNSQGDATMWGNLDEGSVCVKLADPTSGVFNEIHNYDTSYAAGDTYTAKWAIVYEGKAVVLDLVIKYVVEVGINGISADDVVKTQYFGLNGAAIDAPVKGINIVKQTLKNGKVVTSKVFVK